MKWSGNLKKGSALLRERNELKYQFVDAEKKVCPIAPICVVMQISRIGQERSVLQQRFPENAEEPWDDQQHEPKERAAFQMVLKRRPHMLRIASVSIQKHPSICGAYRFLLPICSFEYASEALADVYATIRRGQSGQGSLPCSTPLQSRAGTSPGSPHIHRLPPRPGVGSSNRR